MSRPLKFTVYCSPVTLYPIDVVFLLLVFCCLIYSYMNRTQEIKQNNKWLIDLHHQVAADLSIGFLTRMVLL